MATYVLTDDVLKAIARRLGTTTDTVVKDSGWWAEICEEANQDAYDHIRETLIGEGYTLDQVDRWDHRARWNRTVAVCFALRAGAVAKAYDLEAIELGCKCLDELLDVTLVVGGSLVVPAAASPNIGSGMGPTGIETVDLDLATDLE